MIEFPPELFKLIIEYVSDRKRNQNIQLWKEIIQYKLYITRDYNDITLNRLSENRNYIRRLYIYDTHTTNYLICGFNLDKVILH